MGQAATSIVLIFGQLAVLAAAPAYVCTAADGTQRLEWGDCDCNDGHQHAAKASERWLRSMPPLPAPHIGDAPCHCNHQPLGSDLRLLSRAEPDTRGLWIAAPHCCAGAAISLRPISAKMIDCARRGNMPLADRLSVCLRC